MKNKIIIALVPAVLLAFTQLLPAKTIEELIQEKKREKDQGAGGAIPVVSCVEGRVCVEVASFVKADYKSEAKKFPVGHLTGQGGFGWISIRQHIGGQHGVIVNTVKVLQGGKWVAYTQGTRLPEGRTELQVPVPQGAQEVVISFDHGKDAEVKVILEKTIR